MEIKEEQYQLLLNRVLNYKIQELMQEPYDDDMIEDDFFKNETAKNYFWLGEDFAYYWGHYWVCL